MIEISFFNIFRQKYIEKDIDGATPSYLPTSINQPITKICYIDQSPWDNSDRCGIFWLGWLMDVGRYEGVAPSMCAFASWFWRMSGSCAIYVPENDLFLQSSTLWQFLPLCLAPENGPHQVPRKRIFSWVCQRKLDTWWGPFSGANPSGKLALRWFPPIFFSTSSCLFGHRWRNSNSFAKIRLGMPT